MNQRLKVLIVDDESSQRTGLAAMVSAWGMTPETAADGNEALVKSSTSFAADVILTDLNMPGLDGFGFLQRLRENGDMPPTIVLTAYGNIETAVKTVHELGAYWFLEKPIQPSTLEVLIRRAGSHAELRSEKRVLERNLVYKGSLGEMVGIAPRMQEIFALLQQAGPSKACVLITGESGTGKELVARTLHALSPRRQGPFVAINCAALPETLIESELFGHEKGSFTGASERRAGCFEVAQHGTLLLDEIGEMPMLTQAKLLRILEDSKVRRLGGRTEFEVDVRVLAATNKAARGSGQRRASARGSLLPVERVPRSSAAVARAQGRYSQRWRQTLIARYEPQARVQGDRGLARGAGMPAAAPAGRAMSANCATCWSAR